MDASSSNISFGFKKKIDASQLVKSAVSEEIEKEDNDLDYVLSLEGKQVKSTKSSADKQSKRDYVIPLIKHNQWRHEKNPILNISTVPEEHSEPATPGSLDEQAAKEILLDTARYNQEWDERGVENSNVAIPLLLQNKIPEGFESETKLDVALRPEDPTDADYNQIPIEHFGMAMLRGMGWNKERGIGKKGQVVELVEAHARPKGLGLGADRRNETSDKKISSDNKQDMRKEELALKKNAFCLITVGSHKELYGTVEGIDEDNARVLIKIAINGKTVNVMQSNISLVSQQEFDKFSKYINKKKVDEYKLKENIKTEDTYQSNGNREFSGDTSEKRKFEHDRDSNRKKIKPDKDSRDSSHEKKKSSKDKDRCKNDDRDYVLSGSQDSYHHSHQLSSYKDKSQGMWLQTDLKVRIIDKNLSNGKYYKEKVVIIDVPSQGVCVCRTDSGRVVENVMESSLETVVPRHELASVMIIKGSHRGQVGQVVKRNKDKLVAHVQLFSDRDTLVKLSYDDICEFVGDIRHNQDY